MVRRNGENVACREVEAVFRRHAGVAEAAVVAVPDLDVGEELKVYVQSAEPDSRPDPVEILTFVRRSLAPFKVPRFLTFVNAFAMTESHRVEKKKLNTPGKDPRSGSFDNLAKRWIP